MGLPVPPRESTFIPDYVRPEIKIFTPPVFHSGSREGISTNAGGLSVGHSKPAPSTVSTSSDGSEANRLIRSSLPHRDIESDASSESEVPFSGPPISVSNFALYHDKGCTRPADDFLDFTVEDHHEAYETLDFDDGFDGANEENSMIANSYRERDIMNQMAFEHSMDSDNIENLDYEFREGIDASDDA